MMRLFPITFALPLVLNLFVYASLTSAFEEKVPEVETVEFTTDDEKTIVGDFYPAAKDGPSVVCLHMYRSNRSAWKPLAKKLVDAGINVLAIDMRGHGDSAGNMASRVKDRDSTLFNAMWQDATAAIDWLEGKGLDASRVGICGASVGCSVALQAAIRKPGAVRSVCLLTPGATYLGVDSLADIAQWQGARAQVWCSEEEKTKSEPVADELKHVEALDEFKVLPQTRIHGTRMFGKVENVESDICKFFTDLKSPTLSIPAFSVDDERTRTGGFFFDVLKVQRKVADDKYILMTFAVGDRVTVGALVYQKFAGDVSFKIGKRKLQFAFDTSSKEPNPSVSVDGAESDLKGEVGRVGKIVWCNVELEKDKWFPDDLTDMSLVFKEKARTDKPAEEVMLPSSGVFKAQLFNKPMPPSKAN